VTPKIKEVPQESDYLDILAKDPVPLDKLLAGETIYLTAMLNLSGENIDLTRADFAEKVRASFFAKLILP
jgi:hypothetical protein